MDYKNVIIGLLVAVIAGLGAYLLWPNTTHAPSEEEIAATEEVKNTDPAPTAQPTPTAEPAKKAPTPKTTALVQPVTKGGTYEAYSPGAIGYAALGEVVLFFYTASCPACVHLDKDIVTNAARIPKDVKILKVNYDTEEALKQKYGLSSPHILIQVSSEGNRITQWALSSTLSDLVTRIVRY